MNLYNTTNVSPWLYKISVDNTQIARVINANLFYKSTRDIISHFSCTLHIGGSRNFEKGVPLQRWVPTPNVAKNSRILGLKSWVLITFYGKFRAKKGGGGLTPLNPPLLHVRLKMSNELQSLIEKLTSIAIRIMTKMTLSLTIFALKLASKLVSY
jgi:hypothetical protein